MTNYLLGSCTYLDHGCRCNSRRGPFLVLNQVLASSDEQGGIKSMRCQPRLWNEALCLFLIRCHKFRARSAHLDLFVGVLGGKSCLAKTGPGMFIDPYWCWMISVPTSVTCGVGIGGGGISIVSGMDIWVFFVGVLVGESPCCDWLVMDPPLVIDGVGSGGSEDAFVPAVAVWAVFVRVLGEESPCWDCLISDSPWVVGWLGSGGGRTLFVLGVTGNVSTKCSLGETELDDEDELSSIDSESSSSAAICTIFAESCSQFEDSKVEDNINAVKV